MTSRPSASRITRSVIASCCGACPTHSQMQYTRFPSPSLGASLREWRPPAKRSSSMCVRSLGAHAACLLPVLHTLYQELPLLTLCCKSLLTSEGGVKVALTRVRTSCHNTNGVYCGRTLQVRVPITTILPRAKRADRGSGLDGSQQPSGGAALINKTEHRPLSAGSAAAAQDKADASAAEAESDEDTEAPGEVRMPSCCACC